MTFGNPSKPTTIESDNSEWQMLANANWKPVDLGYDDKFAFGLNELMGKQTTLLTADVSIAIKYELPLIRWKRVKIFPMQAVRQTNGNFYWYPKAN